MNTKILILLGFSLILLSCRNSSKKYQKIVKTYSIDSLKLAKEKEKEQEIANLKEQGIFGKWECNFSGYESTIYLKQENDNYSSIIKFKNNSTIKKESLNKDGEKFFVVGSKAKEYYLINSDGNLELWDKDGFFTTALNIMSGQKSKSSMELDIKKVLDENIYTIIGNYSKSAPKTLNGTNNDYWIVYYADIDVTFKVDKKTNKIKDAKKGEVPFTN